MHQRYQSLLIALLCSCLFASAAAGAPSGARDRINRGTVTIISGGVAGTYIRIASDLANVLDNSDDLRILPIVGKGSLQNIDDLMYLRGVDIGIVQSDVLEFVKRKRTHTAIERHVHYITKLYNEEFHLLANRSIESVEELVGKKVNFGGQRSGTYMTASIVFNTLGLDVEAVSFDQQLALEKVKAGEIAAMVYVAGKPTRLFKEIESGGPVHFLSVDQTPSLLQTYLPSQLTHDDYPQLVRENSSVSTLAIGAVLAVYNWKPGTLRHGKVVRFLDAFFENFDQFQKPPRHAKWKEVNLAAVVPGWTRYAPAAALLRQRLASTRAEAMSPQLEQAFVGYLQERGSGAQTSEEEKERLFEEFMRAYWEQAN